MEIVAESIALALRRSRGNIYLDAQLFTGFVFIGAAVFAWWLRMWKVKQNKMEKAFDIEQDREPKKPITHTSPKLSCSFKHLEGAVKRILELEKV